MNCFENEIGKYIIHHVGNKKVLLLLSGGIDSTVLLNILIKYLPIKHVFALHINYHLRASSCCDEKFVKDLCKKNKIKFQVESHSLKEKKINTGNIQGIARKIRYQSALEVMQKKKIDYLLTGHHKDDSIENFMLKQLKGQSSSSIENIFNREKLFHLKPFINYEKKRIKQYADFHKIEFVEDESNQDHNFERNFLRNNTFTAWDYKFPAWKKNIIRHHESIITQGRLLQALLLQTKTVYFYSHYMILSKQFFLLESRFKIWLWHYLLTKLYPETRFSRGAILNYLKKINFCNKGIKLFRSIKYGTIFYSHQLIGPSMPISNFTLCINIPKRIVFPSNLNIEIIVSKTNINLKNIFVDMLQLNANTEKIFFKNIDASMKKKKYFYQGKKKLLKKIISDNKIPLSGRVFGWLLESNFEKKKIYLGYLSSLFFLQHISNNFFLKSKYFITFDLPTHIGSKVKLNKYYLTYENKSN